MARAVVFSNGEYRDLAGVQRRLRTDDLLICADGALAKVMSMQLLPDCLVGDFDSISPELLAEADRLGVRRLTVPAEKDFTDTDLALQEAVRAGCTEVLLIGAFGGRLDHALGNLFLLPPYARQGINIMFSDGEMDAYLVTKQLSLTNCQGKVISLLPVTEQVSGVTIHGFYYPLHDYTLCWGKTIGISNLPLVDEPVVEVADGVLLVIVTDEKRTA